VREIYLNGGVLHVPEVRTKKLRRGSAEWVSQHFYALMDDSGQVERVVILTEDITEWKKAETALRESEQRYRALAESARDMIFVIDPEDRIIYVNSVSARALGGDAASMIGRRQSDLFPPQIAEGQHTALERVFETGEPLYSERPSMIGGRQMWLSTWLTPLMDDSGRTVSVLGVSRDITELQEAMEKERHLQEQLAHAQRIESVGRLAGGVAHDFNNLLTVILGHLDLLLGDLPPGDTPLRSSLTEILAAAEKARNVAGQLLTFSRRQLLSPQSVDLNDLIRSFSGMLRRLIGEDISIVTRLHDGMVGIKADPLQIEQVLMNLTVNARDAMPHGGSLHIETGVTRIDEQEDADGGGPVPGEYAVLTVSDSGKGMDDATRLRAFDPFFTTKEVGKGTGLGLSTVYGIVIQHGGAIELSSEPGKGTTFRILIPLQEGGADSVQPARQAESDRNRSGTVLVVEDDTAVRQLVCRMLSKAGFSVLECMDPFEAATMASEADGLDLLVTDVVMPGLNGREVHARVSAVRPGVRVLYISGHVGDTLSRHGVSEDQFHFLQKPFTAQALMRKVAEALG
jgi:PAS domain S-box-containing protein